MAEEENEVGLPQKGLNMIIKDVIPEMRIANETRELLNACCVEFVKHVAREAQNISATDQRKTIYHEHVRKALSNLAFPSDYIEAADSVLGECKVAAEKKLRRKNSRLDKCGIPEEELYQLQQELIEKARREQAAAAAMAAQMAGHLGEGQPQPVGVSPLVSASLTVSSPWSSSSSLPGPAPLFAPSHNADDEYDT